MRRYVKQTDEFRCGPVAVINAVKWAGGNLTKKDLPRLTKMCECTFSNGTKVRNLQKALKRYEKFFRITMLFDPPKARLDKHLLQGHAAIMDYTDFWDKEAFLGHYILIVEKKDNYYTICNDRKYLLNHTNLVALQKIDQTKLEKIQILPKNRMVVGKKVSFR
jgi:hypothetical protein